MIAATSGEIVDDAVREDDRVDEEPGHNKEDRDEKRLAEEFELVLGGLVVHRRVDRQAGEERPDDVRGG